MIFKKGELKILYPFYLYYLIIGLSGMIIPFMMIYFLGLNLSYLQISIILATYSLSMVLFEIPTGSFADGFSRKYSVILGFIIAGLAIIGITLTTNFVLILTTFIIIGFGMTLVSGAEESWVIDNLNYYKREDLHKEFFIKMQSILGFAGIISPLIGSYIVKNFSIKPLWYIWGFGFILGAIILLIISKEKYIPKKTNLKNTFKETMKHTKKGFKFVKTHTQTKLIILATIFIAMIGISDEYWQPFLIEINMPTYYLGILFSIISLISMIIPFSARYLEKYNVKHSLIIITILRILITIPVLFLTSGSYLLGASIFIFSNGLLSLRFPLIEPLYHSNIPKKIRATITSIKSMGTQVGLGVGSLIIGYFADIIGPQKIIPLTGLFGIIAIFFLAKIKSKP